MLGKELIDQPQMWQLVLEVNASALSVVAFSPYEDHAMIHETLAFDNAAASPLQALEDAVYDNPLLLRDFGKVAVLYDAPKMLPVPDCDEHEAEALFRKVFPHNAGGSGIVMYSRIESMGTCIAYEMPTDILWFLQRTFHNATIEHPLMPVAAYFQAKHPTRRQGKTMVNLNGNRLDLVVLGEKAPMAINSYRYVEPLDAVYHILSAREHLSLRDTDEIMIAGDRMSRSAISPILRRYVRYVLPAIFPSVMFRAGRASLSAPFEMILAPLVLPHPGQKEH